MAVVKVMLYLQFIGEGDTFYMCTRAFSFDRNSILIGGWEITHLTAVIVRVDGGKKTQTFYIHKILFGLKLDCFA